MTGPLTPHEDRLLTALRAKRGQIIEPNESNTL